MRGGDRIIRVIAACFLGVAAISAAQANPVSIRCTAAQDKDPYFVT